MTGGKDISTQQQRAPTRHTYYTTNTHNHTPGPQQCIHWNTNNCPLKRHSTGCPHTLYRTALA
eukprot:4548622-Prorocentrum_lima.AAC.1